MVLYKFILMLHILGALALFIGIGFEWLCLNRINNTVVYEQLKEWINFLHSLKIIFAISGVVLLLSGIYMSFTVWGSTAWIIFSFAGLVFNSINGSVITGKKIAVLHNLINGEEGKTLQNIFEQNQNQKLLSYFQLRSAISLAIIFMMTFKPDWIVSASAFVAAFIVGNLPVIVLKKESGAGLTETEN